MGQSWVPPKRNSYGCHTWKKNKICGSLESHSLIPKTSCQESQAQSNISEKHEACILIHLHSCTLHMHDKKTMEAYHKGMFRFNPKVDSLSKYVKYTDSVKHG